MAELPKDMIFHYHSDDGITIKVDAIPLVRCKDCMFSDPVQISEIKCFRCQRLYAYVSDEDFCSRGKRKEKNDE